MNYPFRDEISVAKKAPMAEMYYLAKRNLKEGDKLINFASGHPAQEVFQEEVLSQYFNEAMRKTDIESILQYGSHAGYQPLRESAMCFLNKKAEIVKHQDDILITYGATEAIFLVALAFIKPGDKVIVEDPTYVKSLETFKAMGASLLPISLKEDGVDLEQVEEAMKNGARFFYTIPNFGNPSGITMSFEKRKAICELAQKYNCMILEDDPYGELRYRKERISSIKELDDNEMTIYVGSVSKIIAPGLRVGFMVAPKELIKRMIVLKGFSSNGVSTINQYVVWKMFEEKEMYTEIEKICDSYSKKLFRMEYCMDKYFPSSVKRSSPDGGMYLWVTLPSYVDVQMFCMDSAIQLHIPITPGTDFCVADPQSCTSMRINFVKESVEDIQFGIKQVGKLMYEYCE